MPLMETSGNVTADAYAGGVAVVPKYIEDYFSTWLYVGNGASRTITNNIDLATKGGMVWSKDRSAAQLGFIQDTARTGANSALCPSLTGGGGYSNAIDSYTTSGYVISGTGNGPTINPSGDSCVSWSFAKAPKFFDVVTYTGNSTAGQQIAHNLGSTPGFIIVKATNNGSDWFCYHTSLGATKRILLNTTGASATDANAWNNTAPTSTVFTLGAGADVNYTGITYVAYLFAHNAGGFGLTGTDNVISCGSFTTDASGNATVNLGYETQWVMFKGSDNASGWAMYDTMRGMVNGFGDARLIANTSGAETVFTALDAIQPNATGFSVFGQNASSTYIYIAIRRGPMKVPTDATKVFNTVTATGGPPVFTPSFVTDMAWTRIKNSTATGFRWVSRLLSGTYADSSSTSAEAALAQYSFDYQNGWRNATVTDSTLLSWSFQRAPSFFDEVCYTGTGTAGNISHNLNATPELIIFKNRITADNWYVWNTGFAVGDSLFLNATAAKTSGYTLLTGSPTSTTLPLPGGGSQYFTNYSGQTYVAYLFATCAGVSKVGSYTGNGSTQTINCGFTGGARFVLLKATSTTGNWMVYDTARGMTTLTDPFLSLNSTSAETATLGACTTVSTGFAVNESILAGVNTNGVSFVYLAIA